MKKYHVAAGDGKGYYGVNYESYREATELLKISQRHDPQAHIIEEEYHFTNADRIRAMNDEEMATFLECFGCCHYCTEHERLGNEARFLQGEKCNEQCEKHLLEWLKQPVEDLE